MSNIPAVAAAEVKMISTSAAVTELDRAQAQQKVQNLLDRSDVKAALLERGLAPDEISARLASLSDSEMQQLTGQIEQARYGGDILITVLIVVLIIFLIKRM